jgi:hypothetical protein
MTQDERAAADAEKAEAVRQERARRLSACDWTQLPDASVDADVWATYRQALRDVTKQQDFPWDVRWPALP